MSSILVVCHATLPGPIRRALTDDGHILQVLSRDVSGSYLSSVPPADLIIFIATESHDWVLGLIADFRHAGGQTPLLVVCHANSRLTASTVRAAGGDALLYNPYASAELLIRVHSLAERSYGIVDSVYIVGAYLIDPVTNQIWCHRKAVTIGPAESRLLMFLISHAGKYFTCEQLVGRLGLSESGSDYSVRTLIMKLRRKMRQVGSDAIIKGRYGLGYCVEHVTSERRADMLEQMSLLVDNSLSD
ncbi:MAG: winged helix-turn-helix domain-containing protein [Candidatus Obscuribacterales bacterium]|nr:winged helix-turn-helix domain-containing protein [Candidatus Obscuribacterales bacterium]